MCGSTFFFLRGEIGRRAPGRYAPSGLLDRGTMPYPVISVFVALQCMLGAQTGQLLYECDCVDDPVLALDSVSTAILTSLTFAGIPAERALHFLNVLLQVYLATQRG